MKLKKNNVKRRRLAILFAILWLFPSIVYAEVIPEQTEYIYVNDFAKIMNSQQIETIKYNALKLERYKTKIILTTVEEITSDKTEDYIQNMFNLYDIGKDEQGLGVLILWINSKKELYIKTQSDNTQIQKVIQKYKAIECDTNDLVKLHQEIAEEVEKIYSIGHENDELYAIIFLFALIFILALAYCSIISFN